MTTTLSGPGPLLARGVEVSTVTDRLNRIKIDLVPEWTDPPKQRIGEVVDLVNERFADSGGLGGLLDLTGSLVVSGHADLRVTSDGKHIEIGITDKSDSMAWLLADMAERGGSIDELMIVGDEFGPIGGAEGSDAKTAISGAAVYSVGPEPARVPDGVEHLGDGPARFIELLGTVRKSA